MKAVQSPLNMEDETMEILAMRTATGGWVAVDSSGFIRFGETCQDATSKLLCALRLSGESLGVDNAVMPYDWPTRLGRAS